MTFPRERIPRFLSFSLGEYQRRYLRRKKNRCLFPGKRKRGDEHTRQREAAGSSYAFSGLSFRFPGADLRSAVTEIQSRVIPTGRYVIPPGSPAFLPPRRRWLTRGFRDSRRFNPDVYIWETAESTTEHAERRIASDTAVSGKKSVCSRVPNRIPFPPPPPPPPIPSPVPPRQRYAWRNDIGAFLYGKTVAQDKEREREGGGKAENLNQDKGAAPEFPE